MKIFLAFCKLSQTAVGFLVLETFKKWRVTLKGKYKCICSEREQIISFNPLKTPKRVTGIQYRLRSNAIEHGIRSGSPLFAYSLEISTSYSLTYLKSKMNSSNVLCGRVYSVLIVLRIVSNKK